MRSTADTARVPLRIASAVHRSCLASKRKTNEDGALCMGRVPLYAVADGTGGPEAAQVALAALKREAVALIDKNAVVAADPSATNRLALGRFLEGLFGEANTAVFAAAKRITERRIATTLCAATIVGEHAFVAHVGDSRAYLWREGRLRRLTNDHTLAALQRERGARDPDAFAASGMGHALAQALGASRGLDVDLLELRLVAGDLLLITTDGLTRALSEEAIAACLDDEGDLDARADLLAHQVTAAGAPDDATFILIAMTGARRPAARAADNEAMARSSFLFAPLVDTEWHQLQPYLERVEVRAGDFLCERGGEPLGFGVVVSGQLEVELGADEVRRVGPGEHFGALALVSPEQSLETVRALAPGSLYLLSRRHFYELLRKKSLLGAELTLALLESLGGTLGLLTTRLGHLIDAANGRRQDR